MLHVLVHLQLLGARLVDRAHDRRRARCADDRGQSTAEYALVLLGAAGVALLLVTWATKTHKVTDLLDGVLDHVTDSIG